jgi:hypothetical protein
MSRTFLGIDRPSQALQAMLDGLYEQYNRHDFRIDMRVYGAGDGGVCYGCASTCTLQKLAGKDFTTATIDTRDSRAAVLAVDANDLYIFEHAMDHARKGGCGLLFDFFEIPRPITSDLLSFPFYLTSGNWQDQVPSVRRAISLLQESGY